MIHWRCLKCGGLWSNEKIEEFKACPHCQISKHLKKCPACGSVDVEEDKS